MTSILLHEYVEQVENLVDANRLVEAIEHCRHILQHYPRHIDTYRVMGKAFLEKQEHTAATDLFLRILGADPNDFISHVGLSIVYQEESQYDQALWHLERAFEIQPYNVAIQGELRQLYAVETETRPGVIPLTRGALARLYMQGELYQQAISELRRILSDEPERMDLQVLLAEALWRDDQRIDAEEVCLRILEELPNCIVLNAILAEIWLQTGRIPEAQKYLKQLHGLTWQTKKSLQIESIAGRAFITEGAFPLPEEAPLEFLETGTVVPREPAKPTDDWVGEVTFDAMADASDEMGEVVLEPESGMHSYDWLSDIGSGDGEDSADSNQKASETDWFSQETAKEALNLSTSELNADWLADLRGDANEEQESDFQPLEMGSDPGKEIVASEDDWFTNEEDISDELFAELADSASLPQTDETAVDSENDWLNELADNQEEESSDTREKSGLQIDATNLIDENLMNWDQIESDPGIVKEPKTPFWLSEIADEALDAVELNPDEALDWLAEPAEAIEDEAIAGVEAGEDTSLTAGEDQPESVDSLDWLSEIPEETIDAAEIEAEIVDSPSDSVEDALDWLGEISSDEFSQDDMDEPVDDLDLETFGPTTVLDTDEQVNLPDTPNLMDTDSLGDADDWLAALTEGTIEEEINLDDDEASPKSEEIQLDSTTDELSALSDADDWLESASADLESILDAVDSEEEEFPNLSIPDLEGAEIDEIPDWLQTLDHSEEAETAMSSENDPQEKPQADEPEVEPSKSADHNEDQDALDWLADLTTDDELADGDIPLEPPIATEGMPSWLDDAGQDAGVDVVDEWDSQSAAIPDWLQEPVALSELDDADLGEPDKADEVGLTGLLSEMDVSDEAVPLDDMDSLFSDWADEDGDGSLTELLGEMGMDDIAEETRTEDVEIVASEGEPLQSELDADSEEVGLTGLLSNLTLEEEIEDAESEEEDFFPDFLGEIDYDGLDESLADDVEDNLAEGDLFDLDALNDEDFSLTALLSEGDEADVAPTAVSDDEADDWLSDLTAIDDDDDDWLTDLTDATETDAGSEVAAEVEEAEEEQGLTGMLANLWPDEDEIDGNELPETAVSDPIDAKPSKLATGDLGLTELLAGIEYTDDTIDSRPELPEFDEPVEPSLTEILTGMDLEDEPESPELEEAGPISAEDTTWLTQLEADTGALKEQEDDLNMAEETGLDWLTMPDEPEEAPQEIEPEEPVTLDEEEIVQELDSTPEDWDDAMSWLEELAAQQEDPVGELPSVAENMLDEELDSGEAIRVDESDEEDDVFGGTDWLDDLTGDVASSFEEEVEEQVIEPETLPETKVMDESPLDVEETAVPDEEEPETDFLSAWGDSEMSWLDELATGRLAETAIDEPETVPEPVEPEMLEAESDSWLDDLAADSNDEETEFDSLEDLFGDITDEAETAVDEADIGWLDTVLDEPVVADEPEIEDEPDTILEEPIEEGFALEDANRVTGVTDALKGDDGLEEAEADLEKALAWLDDLDEEPMLDIEVDEEPPLTIVTPPEPHEFPEPDLDEETPETIVLAPEPDELTLALDRLEQQVKDEGIDVPETAVFPIMLSDEELNAALDWIEQGGSEPELVVPVVDERLPDVEAPVLDIDEAVEGDDLSQMADDPEAWLEDLLSGEADLDIDMEPPPIQASEDAMFVTDDAALAEQEEAIDEASELEVTDSLLDDVALDGLPEDPDAAVAWLDQLVSGDDALDIEMEPPPIKPTEETELAVVEDELETAVSDELNPEDDPEAWLEQLLSGDLAMDVEMEPPPIKPSEDAMFVTGDAPPPVENVIEEVEPIVAEASDEVEEAALDLGDLGLDGAEDDPEAWLEQLLSDDLAMDIEMEPPPIKPSEDAVYVTDDEPQLEETEAVEEPDAVVEASEVAEDIIAEVPDDPDEAMAWLEQLAARQGADLEELPSVTDASALEDEPDMPDWMAQDVAQLDAEAEVEAEAEIDEALILADDDKEEVADTAELVDEDVDSELPDWLGTGNDAPVSGETDWLQNLPDVDMDSWLSAEAEAASVEPVEDVPLPDTGPLSRSADTGPLIEDELFEPVIEPSSGAYSVDDAKLGVAQDALTNGRIDEAISQFKSLVSEGSGMMAIIAELEQAADAHPQAPALFQVLGDAYMRNGQLQKALAAYRSALNQM